MNRRLISSLPLVKEQFQIPVLVVSFLGFGIAVFGGGIFQELGKLVVGMWLGMLVFGWLLDTAYLNKDGINQGYRLLTSTDSKKSTQEKGLEVTQTAWSETKWYVECPNCKNHQEVDTDGSGTEHAETCESCHSVFNYRAS